MANLTRARKRMTDLIKGMQDPGVIHTETGEDETMSPLQLRVLRAYARQFERVLEDDLQDE
jgi:hypothetical protein